MKKATKTKNPNHLYNIVLRVKGSVKNELIDAAEAHNMSLSEFVLFSAWVQARSGRGVPFPGSAQFAVPDTGTVLRAYLSGGTVLQPCGKEVCDMSVVEVAGFEFCDTCNVRVR
jgi:hypothetical protein